MAIPSSLTLNYDALLTTTLFNYQPKLADNITQGCKFLNYLRDKGQFKRLDGGERVAVPLMHTQNNTADIYSSYGTLDVTPEDGITTAYYDWAQMAVSISISGKEKRQNRGKAAILNLLEAKTMQSEASLKELLNGSIVSGRITSSANLGRFLPVTGRLDSGANSVQPLAALVDANPSRSAAIGNINPNTYAFWRNQSTSSTATTWNGLKLEMVRVYDNCAKGVGGPPDMLLGDQIAWETYWASLANNERYIVTDKRIIDILGGTDMIKFRSAVFIWDEAMPDTETNATVAFGNRAAVGTFTVSTILFLNSDTMLYVVHSDADFMTTPFVTPVGQDASVAEVLWMGALATNNRRKNGQLYGIAQNITS